MVRDSKALTGRSLVLVVCLLLGTLMAGEWSGGTVTKDDLALDNHCPKEGGGVAGMVGALAGFATNNLANGKKTTGDVGARWTGQRFPVCAGEQVIKENWVQHDYTRAAGQPFTRTLLIVRLTSTITVSGSAKRWKATDPQWWWDTTASVIEERPTAEFLLPGGEWGSLIVAFDPNHDTQAHGAAADASNNNQPNFTSPFVAAQGGQNGDTVGGAQTSDSMTKVRVKAKWTSVGGPPSGDNCDVLNEELKLHFDFETWFVAP